MTRFISNVVTYTATQATQQRCNMHEVFKVGLHMIRNMPIVSNEYVLVTRFILIILLDKCTRDLSAMDLWLCALCEVI